MSKGWTVRVDRANRYEPTSLFDVVVHETERAEALVRTYAACASADQVRAIAPLTDTSIEAHGLKEGDVKQWQVNPKVRWSRE